ncbi:MAG: FAD binding domain-containing protein [Gemmatimonadota bacterium]
MQPVAFDYHRPASLAEAIELLAGHDEARPLAGGHSLLPAMKLRLAAPAALVDVSRIPGLTGIEREGGVLRIGAMTVYAEIAASPEVRRGCPVLAEAVALIGDRQVRNRGTIGGSVAHADPAADLPTVLVALDATVEIVGVEGERSVPAREFFQGIFATALGPAELVTAVRVPATPAGTGAAYEKHPHPASRYAVVGVAAVLSLDSGACSGVELVVGGVTGMPARVPGAAEALEGAALSPEAIAAAAASVPAALPEPMGDLYASGEYRVHLATVLARRALERAAERAEG